MKTRAEKSSNEKYSNATHANSSNSIIKKASVYEAVDKKDDGKTIRTRIYCFETDLPILKK